RVLVADSLSNQSFIFTGPPSTTLPLLTMNITAPDSLSVVNGTYAPNPFTITATIANTGAAITQQVDATLYLPSGLVLQQGSVTQSVGFLAPGQQGLVQWSVQAAGQKTATTLTYFITADSSNAAAR